FRLKERYAEVGLDTLCGLFGYTRQAYYKQLNKNARKALDKGFIISQVRLIRKDMPRLGCKKIHYLLKEKGIDNNRMLIKRKKKYAVTTNSKHWMKKYPNLIRGFSFSDPNQLYYLYTY
ncbi:MAG: hypothetical protein ACK5KT_15810, partial [Dysgonomonas sp.]